MLSTLTAATLYQAFVSRSSAHEDLHVVCDKGVVMMCATREMKPGALMLLPFGDIIHSGLASPGSAPVTLEIGGEKTSRVEFRIRCKNTPERVTGTNEKVVVLVPFWVLATATASSQAVPNAESSSKSPAASSTVVSKLRYKITTIQVPQAPQVEKRSGKTKTTIAINTVCMTNDDVVPMGASLVAMGKPPTKLD